MTRNPHSSSLPECTFSFSEKNLYAPVSWQGIKQLQRISRPFHAPYFSAICGTFQPKPGTKPGNITPEKDLNSGRVQKFLEVNSFGGGL
jgi:hypothetical protein